MSFALNVAAWAAATILLSPTATAYNATVSYNITVSDMSPLVRYDPASSWNTTYSGVRTPEYQQGMYGLGTSVHNTYGTGPSASIEFVGSSLRVDGGVDNGLSAPFDWKVDDQVMPQPNFDNGNFSPVFGRIGFGHHQFSATLTPGTPAAAHLKLTQFEIRTAIDSDAPGQVRCNMTDFSAGTLSDNSNFNLSGGWNITRTFGGWQGQEPLPYWSIIAGNTPSVSIYPPPGTSLFKLNGSVGPDYGSYSVEVDPAPPYPYKNNVFSATNAWLKPYELLYVLHLEPGVQYKITVTGDKDPSKYMGLSGAEFCYYNTDPQGAIPTASEGAKDAASTSTDTGSGQKADTSAGGNDKASNGSESVKQGSNAGAIAGGVVGGVLGAALLAILAWWLGRRQGSKTVRQHADPSMFSVGSSSVLATPYHSPAHLTPAAAAAANKPNFPMFAMGGGAPAQGGYQTIESQRGLYGQALSQPSSSSLATPTDQSRRAPSPGHASSPLATPTDMSSPTSGFRSPQRSPQDLVPSGGGLAGPSSPIGGAGYADYKSMLLRQHSSGGDVPSSSKGDGDAKVAPEEGGAAAANSTSGGGAYSLYKNMLLRRQEPGTPTSTLNPLLRDGVHHAEDAGGFPSTLPPVYNPNWRPERPDGAARAASDDASMPTPSSLEHYFSGANRV